MDWLKSLVYGAQLATAPMHIQEDIIIEPSTQIKLPTKVITIDGGGIRGLYTIELIKAIEHHMNGTIADHAHVFSGTSTGAIISCGLAAGKSLDMIENLYENHGENIFYHTTWEYFKDLDGWIGPKYDPSKFEDLLKQNFSEICLSEFTNHHVMAFATDITQQTVKIFDSKAAQKNKQEDVPVWFAIRSTTAAPTYFAPTEWQISALCDGGLLVNNPSTATILQLKNTYGWEVLPAMKMVSLGTGTFATGISYQQASGMGTLQWAAPISDMIMKSSSNMYQQFSQELLSDTQLVRVDGQLSKDITLDSCTPDNLRLIRDAALSYINHNPETIDRAAKMLQE